MPLDVDKIDFFSLSSVPNLSSLMAQLDAGSATAMDDCVAHFRRNFLEPLEAAARRERVAARQTAPVDF